MTDHFKSETREHDLWMLLRLGYGEMPPQAQRMPLARMIINGGGLFQPAPSQATRGKTYEAEPVTHPETEAKTANASQSMMS